MADTGLKSPTVSVSGAWTNPDNVFTSNDVRAREDQNGQSHIWSTFAFGVPGGATIDGILVSIEGQWEDTNSIDVELSWDGGTSWTSPVKNASSFGFSDTIDTVGGAADTWNRTWSDTDFTDANFRIRLTKQGQDFVWMDVDHLQVQVFYTGGGGGGSWLGTWAKRRQITVEAVDVDADLTDFPVNVRLSTTAGKNSTDVSDIFDLLGSDSLKIAFTSDDGVTELFAEVVYWDDTNEQAEIWVKVPSLLAASGGIIYMYYDPLQPDNTTQVGPVNSTPGASVWDSNYALVLHLAETTGNYLDSTSNSNDTDTVTVTSRTRNGFFSSADSPDFDGTNDRLNIPQDATLDGPTNTLEWFFNQDTTPGGGTSGIGINHNPSGTGNNWYRIATTSGNQFTYRWNEGGTELNNVGTVVNGTWYYHSGTSDAGTTTARHYIDGVQQFEDTGTAPGTAQATNLDLGGVGSNWLDGVIDEIRVSSVARPAAWMAATNDTLRDNFTIWGAAVDGPCSNLQFGPYTWDTQGSTDEDDWVFTDPVGTGVQAPNTGRRWCWDSDDTTSTDVGPTSGQGGSPDGYLYTEASAPGAFNDQFDMEFDFTIDATRYAIDVSLYTNQRGNDNDATLEIQTNEGGAGWVTRATYGGPSDPNKVASGGTQIWALRTLDLTGVVSNVNTRLRFLVTFPSSGTSWHNDYGIDTVTINLTCIDTGYGNIINTVNPGSLGSVNTVLTTNISLINTV